MLLSYTWKCLCARAFSESQSSPLAFLLTPRNTQSSVWAAKYTVFDYNLKVLHFLFFLIFQLNLLQPAHETLGRRVWKVSLRCQHPSWCHKRTDLQDRAFKNPAIIFQGCFFFSPNSFQKPSSPPPGVKCAFYSWQLCLTCELLSSLRSTNIIANCSPALQLLLLLCLLIIILAVALSLRNGNDAKGRSPLIIIQHWFVKTGSRSHRLGWHPIYTVYVYTL